MSKAVFNHKINFWGIMLVMIIILFTVGYSAFADEMSISGAVATVTPDPKILITSVTTTSNGATVSTTNHTFDSISSSVSMPNNSTVTYTVEVSNFGNEPMAIYAINDTYLPDDLKILNISGYNVGDKICDNNDSTRCTLNAVKTFTITVGYDNYTANQVHQINLNFEFVRTYDVTYNRITNNNYPAVAYDGKPFQVTFTGDVPVDIIVTPAHNYSYQNGVLSIPNVTDNITINRYYSITYNLNSGTQANNQVTKYLYGDSLTILDPTRTDYVFQGWYENSSFTGNAISSTNGLDRDLVLYAKWGVIYSITYVDITDSNNYPSTIISSNTYTQTFTTAPNGVSVTMGGNTLTIDTDFTYSNGTLTIPNVQGNLVITATTGGMGTPTNPYEDTTTTVYNPADVPANSTIIYTEVPGEPQVTTNSDGNITSFEYNEPVTLNSAVDTGIVVFDGKGFELDMVFNVQTNQNTGNAIFAAMQHESGTKYSGLNFTVYTAYNLFIYAGNNSNLNTNTGVFGSQVNGSRPFKVSNANAAKVTTFTMKFRYLPGNYSTNTNQYGQVYVELSPIVSGSTNATSPYTKNSSVIPASLNSATFTIGGNGYTTNQNMTNFEVVSFSVSKI